MDKKQVLEKSREEYGITDERECLLAVNAGNAAMVVMFAAAVILNLISTLVFDAPSGDLLAVGLLGVAAMNAYQYVKLRNRSYLIYTAIPLLASVIFLVEYFVSLVR